MFGTCGGGGGLPPPICKGASVPSRPSRRWIVAAFSHVIVFMAVFPDPLLDPAPFRRLAPLSAPPPLPSQRLSSHAPHPCQPPVASLAAVEVDGPLAVHRASIPTMRGTGIACTTHPRLRRRTVRVRCGRQRTTTDRYPHHRQPCRQGSVPSSCARLPPAHPTRDTHAARVIGKTSHCQSSSRHPNVLPVMAIDHLQRLRSLSSTPACNTALEGACIPCRCGDMDGRKHHASPVDSHCPVDSLGQAGMDIRSCQKK